MEDVIMAPDRDDGKKKRGLNFIFEFEFRVLLDFLLESRNSRSFACLQNAARLDCKMDWKNLIRGKITFCITAGFAAYSGVQYALTHILSCISADCFCTIRTD